MGKQVSQRSAVEKYEDLSHVTLKAVPRTEGMVLAGYKGAPKNQQKSAPPPPPPPKKK